jgi:hypothetical protein
LRQRSELERIWNLVVEGGVNKLFKLVVS